MPSILGGLAGAGGGFAAGGIPGAVLGGLGGLFGGGQQRMSVAQRRALEQQQRIGNQLYDFSQSTPMTQPGELNSLAQSLGLLGQQQRGALGGLAAGGNILTPTGGTADMLANLTQAGQANRMAISEQHMADAIAARRQALLNAANVNRETFDMASSPGAIPANQLGVQLSSLAEEWAKQKAINEANQEKKTAAGTTGELRRATQPQVIPPNQVALLAGQLATGGGATDTDQSGFYSAYGAANPYALYSQRLNPTFGGTAGAGDAPQPAVPQAEAPPHDVMKAVLELLTLITKTHMALQKPKKKKKAKGAGDAPAMPLPGMGAMAGPPMLQPLPGGNRMQGAQAPGNEVGGANTLANQMRQPASAMLDRLRLGSNALTFPY